MNTTSVWVALLVMTGNMLFFVAGWAFGFRRGRRQAIRDQYVSAHKAAEYRR